MQFLNRVISFLVDSSKQKVTDNNMDTVQIDSVASIRFVAGAT